MEDLGIYTNIRESGNKIGRHKGYLADCKICGKTVERVLYDLRHFNTVCQHGKHDKVKNTEGMPKNFLSDEYNKRVYDLWRHMIMRTIPDFWEKFPTYQGTTVSEEWRNFMTFYEDIKTLDGYEMWKDGHGKRIMLDKDVLGNGQKIYSKDTCCFITHADSNRDVLKRHPENIQKFIAGGIKCGKELGRKIKAINKNTKQEFVFDSLKSCAKELNLNPSHIWMCLPKEEKYKSHKSCKGWIFEELG